MISTSRETNLSSLETVDMKSCTKCHTIKSLDQFGKNRAECKSCAYLRVKAWRSKQKTELITTNLEVLSAKVNEIMSRLNHKAPLTELVPSFLSMASIELIGLLTAAPIVPVAEQPVVEEAKAEAQPSLEVEKLDAEDMYLLINEQDREYITGLYGKEAADFLEQRPRFAQALVSPVNQPKINDLYNKGYRQVFYNPPIQAPADQQKSNDSI